MSRTKNWWKSTSVLLVGGGCAAALAVFGRPAAGQQAVAPTVAITLDDPVVVAQAPPELDRAGGAWGRWQFPVISRLADGQLLVRFAVLPDSAEYYGQPVAFAHSGEEVWWCCSHHWARATADVVRTAVTGDEQGISTNLMIDCAGTVAGPGGLWGIEQRETADGLHVALRGPAATTATVRIHRPAWARDGARVEKPEAIALRETDEA